jgi:hypothetical protein
VKIDLLFDPFGANWHDIQEGAIAAEGEGFDGVWLYDHLAGSVHRQQRVVECWTTLTAIAATVPRIAVGPMVLNIANRHPGTLGVMAATLQEVSGGRLLLGLGAGGGRHTPYAAEQQVFGRPVLGDTARRAALEAAVATIRSVWTGTIDGVGGFLRPDPTPPIIIGGFGPKIPAGWSGGRRRQPAGWTRPGPPGGDGQGVSGCFGAPLVFIRRHRVFGPERSGARAIERTGRRSSRSLRYAAIRQPRPRPGRQPALTTHKGASPTWAPAHSSEARYC